jgi:LysM repeat protein
MFRIFMSLVILITVAALSHTPAEAQGPNLLTNGDMEAGFSARDGVVGVPLGWAFTKVSGSVNADRQAFAPFSHSSPTFWTFRNAYATFVAAGRQTINTATVGATYRAGVFVWVWTCNDNQWACTPSDGPRFSQKESNARVRIGIDPVGGSDPNSGNIAWGPWVQSFDGYMGITMDAVAQSTNISIFIMADSGAAMAFNEFYWDDATLTQVSAAGGNTTAPQPNNQVAAPNISVNTSNFVPFVDPQQARPDGSVVHVVKEGDTLDSIAVAYYRTFGVTKDDIFVVNAWRFPPQYIRIGQEIIILPPGSVDPATGQLTTGALANIAPQPTPQTAAVQPTPGQAAAPQSTPIQGAQAQPLNIQPIGGGSTAVSQPQPTTNIRTVTAAELAGIPALEPLSPFLP